MTGFFVAMLAGVFSALLGTLAGKWKEKKSRNPKLDRRSFVSHDTFENCRTMGDMIKSREWVCRWDVCLGDRYKTKEGHYERLYLDSVRSAGWATTGVDKNVCKFVRLCHFLGCEVYLQEEGLDEFERDIEGMERVVTFMRPEHKTCGADLSYPYNKKEYKEKGI